MQPTVADTDRIAEEYHAATGATYGDQPYIVHPRAVAELLKPYGDAAVIAGLLHDTIEDTAYTLDRMRADGYNDLVVTAVDAVTRRNDETYLNFVRRAARHPLGRLVKLADNHSNASRLVKLAETDPGRAAGLTVRYARARRILLNAHNQDPDAPPIHWT